MMADPSTEEGRRRLEVLVETTDGFRIAEEDLRLRGPGEFYGTKQSGMPTFRFGDILGDEDVLVEARRAASETVTRDPLLKLPEHRALRDSALARLRDLELIAVS
jgi:ATP-dependent DNA helicase RecG